MIKPHYILITNDLFDICSRLREIDSAYIVLYNTLKGCYEVHNTRQADSYCLSVPFDCLDCRTVELVYKTRSERAEQLFKEMESHNDRLEKQMLTNSFNNNIEQAINAAYI